MRRSLAPDELRIGIAVPQTFLDDRVEPSEVRDFAVRAEQSGFADLWSQEVIVSSVAALEGIELLVYGAAVTSSIRLGISAIVLPRHNPVILAKRLATLDQLSRGRLIVGVAVGSGHEQFRAAGLPAEDPAERLVEGLALMKELWTLPVVDHRGQFFQVTGTRMEPKPVQRPHPPIWFGAGKPAALRRAVALAQGWMGAGASTTRDFVDEAQLVREELRARGRDVDDFAISKRVYIAVSDDVAASRARIADFFARIYGGLAAPDAADTLAIVGDVDGCVSSLGELVDAGARHLLLNPLFDFGEQLEALTEVARRLQARGITSPHS